MANVNKELLGVTITALVVSVLMNSFMADESQNNASYQTPCVDQNFTYQKKRIDYLESKIKELNTRITTLNKKLDQKQKSTRVKSRSTTNESQSSSTPYFRRDQQQIINEIRRSRN